MQSIANSIEYHREDWNSDVLLYHCLKNWKVSIYIANYRHKQTQV